MVYQMVPQYSHCNCTFPQFTATGSFHLLFKLTTSKELDASWPPHSYNVQDVFLVGAYK
jgi:hypothetical protein